MIPLTLLVVFIGFSACDTADEKSSSDADDSTDDDSTGDFGNWDDDDDDETADDDSQGDDDSGTEDDDDDNVTNCQLTEGFEVPVFPPSGWTVVNTNPFNFLHWNHRNINYYSGNYCAYIYAVEYYWIFSSNELLYTEQIDLTDYIASQVTFWNFAGYIYNDGVVLPPDLTLEISYDRISWSPIWSYVLTDWYDLQNYPGDIVTLYLHEMIDLNDYLGENIFIGWRLSLTPSGDQGLFIWHLDDIEVCGTRVK